MKIADYQEFLKLDLVDPDATTYSMSHLQDGDFEGLTEEQKLRMKRWMARIMERAYRRGVQQAIFMKEKGLVDEWILENLHDYRYGKSIDVSVGLDGFTTSSIDRLEIEEDLGPLE